VTKGHFIMPPDLTGDSLGTELLSTWRAEVVRAIRATQDGNKVFFDDRAFPWAKEIESRWQSIRAEFDQISRALNLLPGIEEISKSQYGLTRDRRWQIFPFRAYGIEYFKNNLRCPETAKAINLIPGVRAAMFSILRPGKEIPPHEGIYCGVLRFHLGVKVPNPETQCGISVGGHIAHWKEGRSIIFDDTHPHTAWNHSGEDRAVLLVDFPRPLPSHLSLINARMIDGIGKSQLVEHSDQNWQDWENTYGADFDRIRASGSVVPGLV
jgi:aspartyl/asparaginyl beta-hydroxylase (cupin superfamily)